MEIILLHNETQQAARYSFYHNLLGRNVSNTLHMCEYNISILKCFERCNTSDTSGRRKKSFHLSWLLSEACTVLKHSIWHRCVQASHSAAHKTNLFSKQSTPYTCPHNLGKSVSYSLIKISLWKKESRQCCSLCALQLWEKQIKAATAVQQSPLLYALTFLHAVKT